MNQSYLFADLPPEERRRAEAIDAMADDDRVDAMLAIVNGADPSAVIDAKSASDPSLEGNADADEWGPLRIVTTPDAEPVPLDVLPIPARDLVIEASRAIGCPPDFVALGCLAAASGAIGRSASLMRWPGWFASASLYTAIIGGASSGKSPAVTFAAAPIRAIDTYLMGRYVDANDRWESAVRELGPKAKDADRPPRPKLERIDIDGATTEKLPILWRDNPRGLIMIRDEISALVGSFGEFKGGRGTDKEAILSAWSGVRAKKDRVGDDNGVPVAAPHPYLTIVGGTVPSNLSAFVDPSRRGDGFLERFLFTFPAPIPRAKAKDRKRGVADDTAKSWADLIGRLWDRPLIDHPAVVRLSPDADEAMDAMDDSHSAEMDAPGFSELLKGSWGKLAEYANRLALVLCLMDHASDPTADQRAVPHVAERHVVNAWKLVAYFKSHARKVHSAIDATGAGARDREVAAVLDWVKRDRIATFTVRDLTQARRWIGDDPDAMDEALRHLVKVNAIRPVKPDGPGPKGGRPKSPRYDVNPAILAR